VGAQPFFNEVAAAHVQADYFVRPSAPPLDDEEDTVYDLAGDVGWRHQQVQPHHTKTNAALSSK
jgi:hypothetical protein